MCVCCLVFSDGVWVTDWEDLKPPDLTISAGGQDLSYTLGTFTWSENKRAVASESLTPPDLVDVTNEVEAGTTVSIDFDKEPDVMKVGVWEDDDEVLKQIAGNPLPYRMKRETSCMSLEQSGQRVTRYMHLSIKTVGARP